MRLCVWCKRWLGWDQQTYCSARCRRNHEFYGDDRS